jgi:hypothetical protein
MLEFPQWTLVGSEEQMTVDIREQHGRKEMRRLYTTLKSIRHMWSFFSDSKQTILQVYSSLVRNNCVVHDPYADHNSNHQARYK